MEKDKRSIPEQGILHFLTQILKPKNGYHFILPRKLFAYDIYEKYYAYQTKVAHKKYESWSQVLYQQLRLKSVLVKVLINALVLIDMIPGVEQLWQPLLSPEQVHVYEIQEDLLNDLSDPRRGHWYHRVYC